MSTSAQDEMAERRRVVREQGGTYHQHALADAATPRGRYDQINAVNPIGSNANIAGAYPAAAAHHRDPCGPEPPLGYAIDAMPSDEALADMKAVQAQGGPAAPSSHVEQAGPSPPPVRNYRRY
jgi:hypothetical protein